jgi:hypothetical protein
MTLGDKSDNHSASAERRAPRSTNPPRQNSGLRQEFDATSCAVVAAHESYVRESMGDVHQERRGRLQRLITNA